MPARQLDGFGIVDPALHTYPTEHGPLQFAVVSPGDEPKRPAAHGPLHVELIAPLPLPYWPAGHGEHTADAATANWPAAHSTRVSLVDPAGHAYPALHGPAHDDVVAAVVLPYRPASHAPLHVDVVRPDVPPY